MLRKFKHHSPKIHKTAYIAPDAILIGRIVVGKKVSIWPGSVLRADDEEIKIRQGAVILDNATIEAPKGTQVIIGKRSLISHGAVVHGGNIGEGSLVGINAVVLEGAEVGPGSMIGACALITPGMAVPEAKVAMGIPAKVVREVSDDEREELEMEIGELQEKVRWYKNQK